MEPSVARTLELTQPAGSAAGRRASSPYAPASGFSATHRIAGDRISSPPASFLPASVRPWPVGAAAPAFLWAWAPRSFRPALLRAWVRAALAGAGTPAWLPAAPADRATVTRAPRAAGRVQVWAARASAAVSARAPRLLAPPVWHPAAAGWGSGEWRGSPARS